MVWNILPPLPHYLGAVCSGLSFTYNSANDLYCAISVFNLKNHPDYQGIPPSPKKLWHEVFLGGMKKSLMLPKWLTYVLWGWFHHICIFSGSFDRNSLVLLFFLHHMFKEKRNIICKNHETFPAWCAWCRHFSGC